MWYFYALLGPAIWALLNHLDKYLLGRFFNQDAAGPVLVVFTGFAGIVLAIAILLLGPPVFALASWQAAFLIAAGALPVASYMPYMIALQRDEASIVASLYRLAPLFVFSLSYMILGERLRQRQIVGGLVTIAGSILLIVDLDKGRRGLNLVTFFLMCAACLMSAGSAVLFKFIALKSSFWSAAFWQYIGAGIFSIALIGGMPSYRRALFTLLRSRNAYTLVSFTLGGEALNLLANLAVGFAGLMAPLALVSLVTGLHPLFLLAYGILFTVFFPAFGREHVTRQHILQKAIAIGVQRASRRSVVMSRHKQDAPLARPSHGWGSGHDVYRMYVAELQRLRGWSASPISGATPIVSSWFVHRGLAISIAFNGASCGGVVVAPLLLLLVEKIGFPVAMLAVTAVMVVVLVPVVVVWIGPGSPISNFPRRQTRYQLPSQAPGTQHNISRTMVVRRLAFWTISAPFALALMAQIGFIVHQIALLEPKIGRPGAGLAVALTTLMAVIGRICLGMVVDRLNPRLVTAASLVSQATALLAIIPTDDASILFAACAIFGFTIGNLITLPPLIIHREFGAAAFTIVMGLSTAASGIVGALGPGLIGLVRSWSDGYEAALALCILLELVAAAIVLVDHQKQDTGAT